MKLAVVEAYCSGQHEPSATAWLHNVRVSSLRKWISAYRVRGIARIRVKRRGVYNVEFKLAVVQRVRVSVHRGQVEAARRVETSQNYPAVNGPVAAEVCSASEEVPCVQKPDKALPTSWQKTLK